MLASFRTERPVKIRIVIKKIPKNRLYRCCPINFTPKITKTKAIPIVPAMPNILVAMLDVRFIIGCLIAVIISILNSVFTITALNSPSPFTPAHTNVLTAAEAFTTASLIPVLQGLSFSFSFVINSKALSL